MSNRDERQGVAYMSLMDTVLPFLLIAAMGATAIVLFAGIAAFAFNSKLNAKYSNKLMTARVVLQGLALAVLGLIVLAQMF
jgi:Hypoxia induced protein conserved region